MPTRKRTRYSTNRIFYLIAGLNFAAAVMWLAVPNAARILGFGLFMLAAGASLVAAHEPDHEGIKKQHLWPIGLIIVIAAAFLFAVAINSSNQALWILATGLEIIGSGILIAAFLAYHSKPGRRSSSR